MAPATAISSARWTSRPCSMPAALPKSSVTSRSASYAFTSASAHAGAIASSAAGVARENPSTRYATSAIAVAPMPPRDSVK
jgi:hypothetical protein